MAETLKGGIWYPAEIESDLVLQGGLDLRDLERRGGEFMYKGAPVMVSHSANEAMIVTRQGEEDDDLTRLIDAFSRIVEYKPFCKYTIHPNVEGLFIPVLSTHHWGKKNHEQTLMELRATPEIKEIVRLEVEKK